MAAYETAHIDEIGVIARVTPEHKVRLVDMLKSKGHIVAMNVSGRSDNPIVIASSLVFDESRARM